VDHYKKGAGKNLFAVTSPATAMLDWSKAVHRSLKDAGVRQIATVPDGGLTRLLDLCRRDPRMRVVTLASEQEGIGLLAGAWLGGERAALLMQSSGVGNCVNALAFIATCRVPCLMLVTMRGEWGEFNPWQVPMGRAAEPVLRAMGVIVYRLDRAEEADVTVEAAARIAFDSQQAVGVLIAQRLIGRKAFGR
jgi:sulfopyruvate decarboxylase alpha subunit